MSNHFRSAYPRPGGSSYDCSDVPNIFDPLLILDNFGTTLPSLLQSRSSLTQTGATTATTTNNINSRRTGANSTAALSSRLLRRPLGSAENPFLPRRSRFNNLPKMPSSSNPVDLSRYSSTYELGPKSKSKSAAKPSVSASTTRKNVHFMNDPLAFSSSSTTGMQRKRKASAAIPRYDNSEVVPLINELKTKIAKLENHLHSGREAAQVRGEIEYIQIQLGKSALASAMAGLQAMIDALENCSSHSAYAKQLANKGDQFVLLLAQQLCYYQSHYKETHSKEELLDFLDQIYIVLRLLLFRLNFSSQTFSVTSGKDWKLSRESVHQLMEALITLLVTDGMVEGRYRVLPTHYTFCSMALQDLYYLIVDITEIHCDERMHLEFGQFHAVLLRLLRDSVKKGIFVLGDPNQEKIRQQKKTTDQRVGLLLAFLKNLSNEIFPEDVQSAKPIIYEIFSIFELYSKSEKDFSFFDVNMRPLEFAKSFILQFVAKCAKLSTPVSNSWKCFSLVQGEIESSKRLASSVSMYNFLENRGHSIEAILSLNKRPQQQQAQVSAQDQAQENPTEPTAAVEEITLWQPAAPVSAVKPVAPKKSSAHFSKIEWEEDIKKTLDRYGLSNMKTPYGNYDDALIRVMRKSKEQFSDLKNNHNRPFVGTSASTSIPVTTYYPSTDPSFTQRPPIATTTIEKVPEISKNPSEATKQSSSGVSIEGSSTGKLNSSLSESSSSDSSDSESKSSSDSEIESNKKNIRKVFDVEEDDDDDIIILDTIDDDVILLDPKQFPKESKGSNSKETDGGKEATAPQANQEASKPAVEDHVQCTLEPVKAPVMVATPQETVPELATSVKETENWKELLLLSAELVMANSTVGTPQETAPVVASISQEAAPIMATPQETAPVVMSISQETAPTVATPQETAPVVVSISKEAAPTVATPQETAPVVVSISKEAAPAKETPVPETSKQQSKEEILAQVQAMHQNLLKSQQKINELLLRMAEKKN